MSERVNELELQGNSLSQQGAAGAPTLKVWMDEAV